MIHLVCLVLDIHTLMELVLNKDYAKALELYTRAAEAGYLSAQYNLGYMYYYGEAKLR